MEHQIELLMKTVVTHDTRRFVCTRPEGFTFKAGQGVELAIDEPQWRDEGRPFTPTSLPDADLLEFTIKIYPDHQGVTHELDRLQRGDRLRMSSAFGAIQYRGPGTFIAGGAGITPFLAIFRELAAKDELSGQSLIFSNRTQKDIICQQELQSYMGDDCTFVLTGPEFPGYLHGRIDGAFLKERLPDLDRHVYLCGPPDFMDAITADLKQLGVDPESLVFEE